MKSSNNGDIMNEDFKYKVFARRLILMIRESGRTNFILKSQIESLIREYDIS